MTLDEVLAKLANAPQAHFEPGEPFDAAKLALQPHFGSIEWTPPALYRDLLARGAFTVRREDPNTGVEQTIRFLVGDDFTSTNEDLVHMPEGVSIDEGVVLSTNHLVGFAEAGGEAVWCFDVTQPGYPVYYHHQDAPRARRLADGAWDDLERSEPEFPSFQAWLDTIAVGFAAPEGELPAWFEVLGEPYARFD